MKSLKHAKTHGRSFTHASKDKNLCQRTTKSSKEKYIGVGVLKYINEELVGLEGVGVSANVTKEDQGKDNQYQTKGNQYSQILIIFQKNTS